jgi:hypothetical protein
MAMREPSPSTRNTQASAAAPSRADSAEDKQKRLEADSAAIRGKALAAGINQVVSKSDLTELIGKSQALTRDLE